MPYDIKKFRTVKHGIDATDAHCRHCKFSEFEGDVSAKARRHAKKTLHTVDVYRSHHVEYTSHVK